MNKLVLAPTSLPTTQPLEYIDAATEAGYDGIGLRFYASPGVAYHAGSPGPPPVRYPVTGNATVMRDVERALDNTGLLYEICSFYVQPETDLDGMQAPLELGAKLGARYAMVIGDDPDWSRMVDTFARLGELLARFNLTAGVEAPVARRQSSVPPGMMGRISSVEMAVKLIGDSGCQNAGVVVDPLSFHKLGHHPDVLETIDPKLLPYTQIRDACGENGREIADVEVRDMGSGLDVHGRSGYEMGTGREVHETGQGPVPLAAILDALPANLPLSVEWALHKDSHFTAREWAKHTLEGTRNFLNTYYATRQ